MGRAFSRCSVPTAYRRAGQEHGRAIPLAAARERSQGLFYTPARQPMSQKLASSRVASVKIAISSASRAGVA
jgi:hypothetical protein